MPTSRRKFLRTGLLAAAAVMLPAKYVFGQSWKERDGNPGQTETAQSNPLGNYSKATFNTYVNSVFQIHTSGGIIEAALTQVEDMRAPRGGECFTLLFRGGSRPVRQDTYVIVHASLGTFALLLVPSGADQNGAQGYLATINRLSPADFANMAAPTRTDRSTPADTRTTTPESPSPASTPPSGGTVAPANPVIPVPAIVPATPAPSRKRKRLRKRKPSWKENDLRVF